MDENSASADQEPLLVTEVIAGADLLPLPPLVSAMPRAPLLAKIELERIASPVVEPPSTA
jgi:hypothetical protein